MSIQINKQIRLFVVGAFAVLSASDHLLTPVSNPVSFASQRIATDPLFASQSNVLSPIGIEQAWDVTTGSRDVVIALIDDAIDINHPDLRANLVPGKDFVDNDNDTSPSPNSGCIKEDHGTSMAGIIGAVASNSIGVAGINWNVKIMPLRIGCIYNDAYERQAIEYAIQNGAHIINSSYGGPMQSRFENEITTLLKNAPNVLWVTAAGNHHGNNDYAPMYPAKVDIPNRISVAASESNNTLAHWSQYGPTSVDVAAPGTKIPTTSYSSTGYDKSGFYESVSGTSPATAIVSGVAALMKAKDLLDGVSNFSGADLKAALLASVNPLQGTSAKLATDGVIHARKALDYLDRMGPVIVVKKVEWDDGASGNKTIDANESGVIRLTLENIGAASTLVNLRLTSAQPQLVLQSTTTNIANVNKGARFDVSFAAQSGLFSGWKSFGLTLDISVSGSNGNDSFQRSMVLEAGLLNGDGQWLNETIQRDAYDELRYYHTNVPSGYDMVAFEIEYSNDNARDMGLAAKAGVRPKMYFGTYTGQRYTVDSNYVMDGRAGVERVLVPVDPASQPRTVHAAVFNTPDENIDLTYNLNRSFKIRSCWMSQKSSNLPPVVSAGSVMLVNPDSEIRLQGSVSDPEGQIVNYWWDVPIDVADRFSGARSLNPIFLAPITGEFTFKLNASDGNCGYASATVLVRVKDENDGFSGLLITPTNYETYENSNVQIAIQGSIAGVAARDLTMLSAPSGVEFDPDTRQLRWNNVGPIGQHGITFSARDASGKTATGTLRITVKDPSQGVARGGGCTIARADGFDPTLLILVFVALTRTFYPRRLNFR